MHLPPSLKFGMFLSMKLTGRISSAGQFFIFLSSHSSKVFILLCQIPFSSWSSKGIHIVCVYLLVVGLPVRDDETRVVADLAEAGGKDGGDVVEGLEGGEELVPTLVIIMVLMMIFMIILMMILMIIFMIILMIIFMIMMMVLCIMIMLADMKDSDNGN